MNKLLYISCTINIFSNIQTNSKLLYSKTIHNFKTYKNTIIATTSGIFATALISHWYHSKQVRIVSTNNNSQSSQIIKSMSATHTEKRNTAHSAIQTIEPSLSIHMLGQSSSMVRRRPKSIQTADTIKYTATCNQTIYSPHMNSPNDIVCEQYLQDFSNELTLFTHSSFQCNIQSEKFSIDINKTSALHNQDNKYIVSIMINLSSDFPKHNAPMIYTTFQDFIDYIDTHISTKQSTLFKSPILPNNKYVNKDIIYKLSCTLPHKNPHEITSEIFQKFIQPQCNYIFTV